MTDEIPMTGSTTEQDPPRHSEAESPQSSAAEAPLEPPHPVRSGPRPERHPLVPLWVYGLLAALLALVAIGIGAALALNRSVTAPVPSVMGLESGVARARIRAAGFEFATGDRRFSATPVGTVLEQDPQPGELARKGTSVEVVVSAGTEEFLLPDIVGDGLTLGRGTLEARGLEVKVNAEASDQPRDTVLSTNPSPGSIVHTGDIVIVSVAASETVSGDVVPYRFGGARFVLDPSNPKSGPDVPLEVSRRLRSLLEASGAAVVVTRGLAESSTVQSRARKARVTGAAALIGLDVAESGGGFAVATPSGLGASRADAARRLSNALFAALTLQSRRPQSQTISPDLVMRSTTAPAARVSVGALTNRDDAASFRDPVWADQVARAIYRALGETYGTR